MKQAFVATLKLKDPDDMPRILNQYFPNPDKIYSFLRWPHQVSGIQPGIPNGFACLEGQVFSRQAELRWKQTPKGLDLLYLGIHNPTETFTHLPGHWTCEDYEADLYGDKQNQETRFPKSLNYPKNLAIGQRYFINSATARVHFIALIPRSL